MLDHIDPWLMEDEVSIAEPVDVLRTMPEIRQLVDRDSNDDELGLRSLLEHPEALAKAWWQGAHAERRQRTRKSAKRHADVLRAA